MTVSSTGRRSRRHRIATLRRRRVALAVIVLGVLAAAALGGCGSLSYYAQSVRGQLELIAVSRPVDDLLSDPQTTQEVRERLASLAQLRRFAVDELALPDSGSYRHYAQLGREAAVWSLVATPPDSLRPREWCYPVIGCASYRGYFRESAAQAHAQVLIGEGWDVAVEPVPAYSTLGWFDDPLPSTVIRWPLADIAGLVFHELTHELLYVAGDSAFNEAYATVVEREGVRRWLEAHGTEGLRAARAARDRRRGDFLQLLADARAELVALYADPVRHERLDERKQAIFIGLRERYAAMKESWGGYAGYDRWFDRPLNNAHLASVNTYQRLVPAFTLLLQRAAGDMRAFHAAVREIAALQPAARRDRLARLLVDAGEGTLAAMLSPAVSAGSAAAAD